MIWTDPQVYGGERFRRHKAEADRAVGLLWAWIDVGDVLDKSEAQARFSWQMLQYARGHGSTPGQRASLDILALALGIRRGIRRRRAHEQELLRQLQQEAWPAGGPVRIRDR